MSDVVAVTEAVGVVDVGEVDPVVDSVELTAAGEEFAAAAMAPVHISYFCSKEAKTN